jgi:chitinase
MKFEAAVLNSQLVRFALSSCPGLLMTPWRFDSCGFLGSGRRCWAPSRYSLGWGALLAAHVVACGQGDVVPMSDTDELTACTTEEEEVKQDGIPKNGFTEIVSRKLFEELFPCSRRNPLYTYVGLAKAADSYPEFVGTGSDDLRKREVAAFLANMAQETGELDAAEEYNKSFYCTDRWGDARYHVCDPKQAPTNQSLWYYGRGPIQLTWNPNYGAASEALGYGLELLEKPYLVAAEAKIAWQTGLWFWMTCAGCSYPPHESMVNDQGFGMTIRAINGGIECGDATESANAQRRILFYQRYAERLGVDPGEGLSCVGPVETPTRE